MTKKVIAGSLALLAVTAMYAQTYQLPNVGFENWENAKGIIHASSGNAHFVVRTKYRLLCRRKFSECNKLHGKRREP